MGEEIEKLAFAFLKAFAESSSEEKKRQMEILKGPLREIAKTREDWGEELLQGLKQTRLLKKGGIPPAFPTFIRGALLRIASESQVACSQQASLEKKFLKQAENRIQVIHKKQELARWLAEFARQVALTFQEVVNEVHPLK